MARLAIELSSVSVAPDLKPHLVVYALKLAGQL